MSPSRIKFLLLGIFPLLIVMLFFKLFSQPSEKTVSLLFAGSLVNLFEEGIKPKFEKESGFFLQGEGEGSLACLRYIKEGIRKPDVFVSADPEAVKNELMEGESSLVNWQLIFLGDRMVIAYNPKSKFLPFFKKVERGEMAWYELLHLKGFRFARTDPNLDPKGYRMLFVAELSENFYRVKGLRKLVESFPIYRETELMARLEIGEIDAAGAYAHEAIERGLPFIELPPEVNLGNRNFASFYKKASFVDENGVEHRGSPIVFSLTIPKTSSNKKGAQELVKFLLSSEAKEVYKEHGFELVGFYLMGKKKDLPSRIGQFLEGK